MNVAKSLIYSPFSDGSCTDLNTTVTTFLFSKSAPFRIILPSAIAVSDYEACPIIAVSALFFFLAS